MIKSITLRNLLSFGHKTPELELRELNVMIGTNGAGKSNFLAALSLLKAATEPRGLFEPMKKGGGAAEWLRGTAAIGTNVVAKVFDPAEQEFSSNLVSHHLELYKDFFAPKVYKESVGFSCKMNQPQTHEYEFSEEDVPPMGMIRNAATGQYITTSAADSILGERKRPPNFCLEALESLYNQITIYNTWSFGANAPGREDQRSDQPSDFLSPNADNLVMVLSDLIIRPAVKDAIINALNTLMPDVIDLQIRPSGGRLQLYLREGDRMISGIRLSDGTLRFLWMLAILCNPKPPAIVCLEEPELGMHPDVIPTIAELLREASARCQLFVTTHSTMLLECFSKTPEVVLVVEKPDADTIIRRLDAKELEPWLHDYSLGQLWSRGELGGNRY